MDIQQERIGFEKKFYHLCEPVVQEAGYRLYDLEYVTGQKILRLFIQDPKTGSAVIEDCIKVDHALTEPFEKETWIPEEIVLEVSSPGIYRNVMNLEHFKMSIGEILAVVITGQLSEEQTAGSPKGLNLKSDKKFRGKLIEANQEDYKIEVKGFNLKLNYKQTKKVNLDPDLKSARE